VIAGAVPVFATDEPSWPSEMCSSLPRLQCAPLGPGSCISDTERNVQRSAERSVIVWSEGTATPIGIRSLFTDHIRRSVGVPEMSSGMIELSQTRGDSTLRTRSSGVTTDVKCISILHVPLMWNPASTM
jgi:hypothetical protein